MQLTGRTVDFDSKGFVRVLNIQRLFVASSYSVISLGEVRSRFTAQRNIILKCEIEPASRSSLGVRRREM